MVDVDPGAPIRRLTRRQARHRAGAVPWLILVGASVMEIGWAISLKYTEGFTEPLPSVVAVIGIVGSFVLLARASRDIPIGTAYGVFVGIGAGGTGALGMVLFDESTALMRIVSLLAIVAGVVGLKLFDASGHARQRAASP